MAESNETMDTSPPQKHAFLNTTFPVPLPEMPELRLTRDEFTSYIRTLCSKSENAALATPTPVDADKDIDSTSTPVNEFGDDPLTAPFVKGLLADKAAVPTLDERDGKMLTENADVAYRTTKDPLVDLFYELESVVGNNLGELLRKAWEHDSTTTLKIIWNARSIHLGKSNRHTFYRAIGWLYENHPATMLLNLPWLVRPVIQKKLPKPDDGSKTDGALNAGKDKKAAEVTAKATNDDDSDFEMIGCDAPADKPANKKAKLDDIPELSDFDVKYGGAHGYWKDLVNILALAAKGELRVNGDPRKVLNVDNRQEKPANRYKPENSKKEVDAAQYAHLIGEKLIKDSNYTALHMTVARLFAEQLQLDMQRLESGNKQDLKAISMAGKWAPTHKESHDRATRVVSSIAEIMFPFEKVCPNIDPADRTLYLKYARQEYHFRVLPKLRKHLQVVERPITANKFEEIQYDRVPSLAMKAYTPLFARKDFDHFDKYIENVAQGKAQISGATLMPSTLVHDVTTYPTMNGKKTATDQLVAQKLYDTRAKALEGQWNTLVQRIKDSGTLESSIAVCDVSGSMSYPQFHDSTTPMDSSIALSLLLAEVTQPPFGGTFITFHEQPQVMHAGGPDDKRSFKEKVEYIRGADWGGSTNFVAVFEDLILPMAIKNNLKKEDMVKQVFVFSDMQFNTAQYHEDRWTTSYERIKEAYNDAGYDMPHLIFWNLAGGRAGMTGYGDETAPKPVTAADEGTSLVSGYSQAQLKMFLDGGGFENPEKEVVVEAEEGEDGDEVVVGAKKQKQDPLDTVKKAVSHEAYRMLKVMD